MPKINLDKLVFSKPPATLHDMAMEIKQNHPLLDVLSNDQLKALLDHIYDLTRQN